MTSGNPSVDAMASICIRGNIVSQEWFRHILRDNGKPYLLAIMLLSDIVYWFRPTEIRDEGSSCTVAWRKKFKGDTLVKSYQGYADQFGESKRSIKAALAALEHLGVISKVLETTSRDDKALYSGNFYIYLNTDRLKSITDPELKNTSVINDDKSSSVENTAQTGVSHNFAGGVAENCMGYDKTLQGGMANNCTTLPQNDDRGGTEFCRETYITPDNTPNTTEGDYHYQFDSPFDRTIRKPLYPSPLEKNDGNDDDITLRYIETIKRNIEYDSYMSTASAFDRCDIFEELFRAICDVVCVPRDSIRINGTDYPYAVVKGIFMKLNIFHLEYVMDNLKQTNTNIINMRQYMISALYNAGVSMNVHYQQKVNYDLHGDGRFLNNHNPPPQPEVKESSYGYDIDEIERTLVSNYVEKNE